MFWTSSVSQIFWLFLYTLSDIFRSYDMAPILLLLRLHLLKLSLQIFVFGPIESKLTVMAQWVQKTWQKIKRTSIYTSNRLNFLMKTFQKKYFKRIFFVCTFGMHVGKLTVGPLIFIFLILCQSFHPCICVLWITLHV